MQNSHENQPSNKRVNRNFSDKYMLDFRRNQWEKGIYTFYPINEAKNHKSNRLESKKKHNSFSENEIFLCVLISAILAISIGGNSFIQNRTKQQIVYSSIPEISSSLNHD